MSLFLCLFPLMGGDIVKKMLPKMVGLEKYIKRVWPYKGLSIQVGLKLLRTMNALCSIIQQQPKTTEIKEYTGLKWVTWHH